MFGEYAEKFPAPEHVRPPGAGAAAAAQFLARPGAGAGGGSEHAARPGGDISPVRQLRFPAMVKPEPMTGTGADDALIRELRACLIGTGLTDGVNSVLRADNDMC